MRTHIALAAIATIFAAGCSTVGTEDNPIRIEAPAASVIQQEYPREALERGVSGQATIECMVNSNGVLDRCTVLEESPAGYGFGDAALRLAPAHRAKPSNDGTIPAGRWAGFPVQFTAPPR